MISTKYLPPPAWVVLPIMTAMLGINLGWDVSHDAIVADVCGFAAAWTGLRLLLTIDHPDTPARPWRLILPVIFFSSSVSILPQMMADISATSVYRDGYVPLTDPYSALFVIARWLGGPDAAMIECIALMTAGVVTLITGNFKKMIWMTAKIFAACGALELARLVGLL